MIKHWPDMVRILWLKEVKGNGFCIQRIIYHLLPRMDKSCNQLTEFYWRTTATSTDGRRLQNVVARYEL